MEANQMLRAETGEEVMHLARTSLDAANPSMRTAPTHQEVVTKLETLRAGTQQAADAERRMEASGQLVAPAGVSSVAELKVNLSNCGTKGVRAVAVYEREAQKQRY